MNKEELNLNDGQAPELEDAELDEVSGGIIKRPPRGDERKASIEIRRAVGRATCPACNGRDMQYKHSIGFNGRKRDVMCICKSTNKKILFECENTTWKLKLKSIG